MKVAVCELPHDPGPRDEGWEALKAHCAHTEPDVVLLPEMPFTPWLAATKEVDPAAWQESVDVHAGWLDRLDELGAPVVVGTRPIVKDGSRLNEAFVWEAGAYSRSHHKYYLPDEDGFWEATWYSRGRSPDFPAVPTAAGTIGLLVCTEIWFTAHARELSRKSVVILANPRATEWASREKWLAGGRAAAVMSGAFCLSSNHSGVDAAGMRWGGYGWVIDPDGKVIATTSEQEPFATVEIEPLEAERAKSTYPRYVPD